MTDAIDSEVGENIIVGVASLVHLTVRHADGTLETIHTTDEHHEVGSHRST